MHNVRPQSAQTKSHGAYAKYFDPDFAAKQHKPKLAVIHPLPTKPHRQNLDDFAPTQFQVQATRLNIKPVFQEKALQKKPIPNQIVKPFLYVEKVIPKRKTEDTVLEHPDVWSRNTAIVTQRKPKKPLDTPPQPKIDNNNKRSASIKTNKTGTKNNGNTINNNKSVLKTKDDKVGAQTKKPESLLFSTQQISKSHQQKKESLFEIERRKQQAAVQFFEKLSQLDNAGSLKLAYWVWAKRSKIDVDKKEMLANLQNFLCFIKEFSNDKIKPQVGHAFFTNFHKPLNTAAVTSLFYKPQPLISIKALAYNFEVYQKSKKEISNILSEKAAQNRYLALKAYVNHWNQNYPSMKQIMQDIKDYEDGLRRHFQATRDSYRNPFEQQIGQLTQQLNEPMIKYDKTRKQALQRKIEEYNLQHQQNLQNIGQNYERLTGAFEEAILPNHNLFFKKKVILKLITPVLAENNIVLRETLEHYIGQAQERYQQYLNLQRELIDHFCTDKKAIGQTVFTLGELAMFLHKNHNTPLALECMKKLIKQVKRQHCIKYDKYVSNLAQFPSDEQIELQLMIKCFEIECTKVLFKNEIWMELLQNIRIPEKVYESKFHSQTINMNITVQATKRLLEGIDSQLAVQLCKSRQISKLVQDVGYHQFGDYCDIILNIDLESLDDGSESDLIIKNIVQSNKKKDQTLAGNVLLGMIDKEIVAKDKPNNFSNIQKKLASSLMQKMFGGGEDQPQPIQSDKKVQFADLLISGLGNLGRSNEAGKKSQQEKEEEKPLDLGSLLTGDNQINLYEEVLKEKQQQILQAARHISRQIHNKSSAGFHKTLMPTETIQDGLSSQLPERTAPSPQLELSQMKTMTKSFFVSQPINVNAFDIRFHDKSMQQHQEQKNKTMQTRLQFTAGLGSGETNLQNGLVGKSILLSNLPKVEQLPNEDPLRVSKFLLQTLEGIDKQNKKVVESKITTRNIRDGVNTNYYKQQVDLEKKPTVFDCEGNTKYSLLLPVGYYATEILKQGQENQADKWFLRPHHVESLTENPLSHKDNLVKTEYNSRVDRLPPKKRDDEYVIEQNVKRKQVLISELEERIRLLKEQAAYKQRNSHFKGGAIVSASLVDSYFENLAKNKQDKDLEVAAAQSLLYDLRRKERDMVVEYREEEMIDKGYPHQQKWWQRKDKQFVDELIRYKNLEREQGLPQEQKKHTNYIRRLNNEELY